MSGNPVLQEAEEGVRPTSRLCGFVLSLLTLKRRTNIKAIYETQLSQRTVFIDLFSGPGSVCVCVCVCVFVR